MADMNPESSISSGVGRRGPRFFFISPGSGAFSCIFHSSILSDGMRSRAQA